MDETNVRRRLTGFAKSLILVMAIAAGGLLMDAPAAAAPPAVPPFSQCPPVGFDTSCAVLIVIAPFGGQVTVVDPTQGPFDGVEDTLIGVQNNSSTFFPSITLSAPGIGDLDKDGLCSGVNSLAPPPNPAFQPPPAGCPY